MCVHKITYKKVNFSINCVFLVRTTPEIITSHEPKPDLLFENETEPIK